MKKSSKAFLIVFIIIFIIGIALILHFATIRTISKPYNLTEYDDTGVPEALNAPFIEGKARLSQIEMQYYTLGEGYPLIFVHGNGGNHTSMENLARRFAHDYEVYLIESRCHGNSTVTDVINYNLMADDINEFINVMDFDEKPIVIGLSDGGINALTLAIRHPDTAKAIVSFGANTNPSEFKFYFTAGVSISNLFNKSILNDMMLTEPNITEEQLASITVPSYIVAGEYDIMYLSDTVYIAETIPNAELTIMQGMDHSNYVHDGAKSYKIVKDFIEKVLN